MSEKRISLPGVWILGKWWSRCVAMPLAALLLPLALGTAAAWAQEKKPDKKKDEEKDEIPAPEDIQLITADGVQLTLTYYPGTKGAESIPVVLLHMWKGKRSDYRDLALHLQATGHAVIVPDLRGHGDSTIRKTLTKTETLKGANLTLPMLRGMVDGDMIAVREFLRQRNNAGKLNLNKLCIVGAEMGASVALDYARLDAVGYGEGNPPGSPMYGGVQVGRFVKALVLLSPEMGFKGLNAKPALDNPVVRAEIPVLILVGKEPPSKPLKEAERIDTIMEKYHKEPADAKPDKKTLFFGRLETPHQGTKMLDVTGLNVDKRIALFIELRLIKSDEAKMLVWKKLPRPHEKT